MSARMILVALLMAPTISHSDVTTHIIDVGAGLCTVTELPNNRFFVYDTGRGSSCRDGLIPVIGNNDIDLLIISHNDHDHYGGLQSILTRFDVVRFMWTGFPRWDLSTWRGAVISLAAHAEDITEIIDLSTGVDPQRTFNFGGVSIEVLYGLPFWRDEEHHQDLPAAERPPNLDDSKLRNVISIVAKLTFNGNSILFAGDTVGKQEGVSNDCFYAESEMVANSLAQLDSDILIAGHHGADNASATCFIQAVTPDFVVFSAGSQHGHPSQNAVDRIRAVNSNVTLVRTDLGDDLDRAGHWEDSTTITNCNDPSGDDNITVVLPSGTGQVTVTGTAVPSC